MMKICDVCGKTESCCECIPEFNKISTDLDHFEKWASERQSMGGLPWSDEFMAAQRECWIDACAYAAEACARVCDYRAASMWPIVKDKWDEAVYLARIIRGNSR